MSPFDSPILTIVNSNLPLDNIIEKELEESQNHPSYKLEEHNVDEDMDTNGSVVKTKRKKYSIVWITFHKNNVEKWG